MTITIDNAIERLNTPRAIFDEEITKANLIPVFEELKANDDEDDMLDLLLYRISDADYFDDMSWILTQISEDDEDYPKTHRFLENIIENVKKEYTSTELTDLCDVIADKLTNARSTSSFTSFLECSEDFDSATVTILNGTHYLECSIDDNERYCIRDIYDTFEAIDNTYAGIAARFEDYAETLRVFDKSQLMSYLTMFAVFNKSFFSDNPIIFTKVEQEHIALINECGDETVIDADDLHALKNKLAPYYDRFINQVTKHYEFVTLDDGAIVTNIEPVQ